MQKIKNIAIIAHVDHGKTTLIDAILRQAGVFRDNQKVEERVMDSNDLEREKGITIFSKNAAFNYKDYKINIVDTPGHADFGGEVQRIFKMVDSVLILIDAFEGPMPQTKYVLKKSLELGFQPIVIINKIDRENSRPNEVLDMTFDLFVDLQAHDEQLDFPVLYVSAKEGIAKYDMEDTNTDLIPMFDTIIKHVKDTEGDESKPFQWLASAIEYDNYLGKLGTGKIHNGKISQGEQIVLLKRDGSQVPYSITKIFAFEGLKRKEMETALAGDIVMLAGMETLDVGETAADKEHPEALPFIDIDQPTLAMKFMANDSPFLGQDGKYVTSRNIWDRLQKELQSNVSLVIEQAEDGKGFIVKGRGELQLAILIENMRREGYELQVSKPEVIYKKEDGKLTEPYETVVIDVGDEFSGAVIEKMGVRKGEMLHMQQGGNGYTRLEFKIPARGLIGFSSEFMTDTRGTGVMHHSFLEYGPHKGEIPGRNTGSLVALEQGVSLSYGLDNIKDRGVLFIGSGVQVYEGMVVGENNREDDLVINVCKGKKLTNTRAAGSDDAIKLAPPKEFSLEQALEYIAEDELLEITPNSLRMRKKILGQVERKRSARDARNAQSPR